VADLKNTCLVIASAQGLADQRLREYQGAFEAAWSTVDLPLPCPYCYSVGRVGRLSPKATQNHVGAVRCEACNRRIEFDDPAGKD